MRIMRHSTWKTNSVTRLKPITNLETLLRRVWNMPIKWSSRNNQKLKDSIHKLMFMKRKQRSCSKFNKNQLALRQKVMIKQRIPKKSIRLLKCLMNKRIWNYAWMRNLKKIMSYVNQLILKRKRFFNSNSKLNRFRMTW